MTNWLIPSGPVTLDQFWTISNDALKPFDLLSAILQKFPSSLAKAQHSSHSMGHEMQKMEGSLTFCVQEWRWFCKTKIRSQKQPATAVTLFDSTRSGMTHSDPSVSIFDSMHVVEVTSCFSFSKTRMHEIINSHFANRLLSWIRWRDSAIQRSTILFLWLQLQLIFQVMTSLEHFMNLLSWCLHAYVNELKQQRRQFLPALVLRA